VADWWRYVAVGALRGSGRMRMRRRDGAMMAK